MIATFYSYKGGVGRSMLLANIGDWISSQGARVVMIDWDLEAPGLENYFCQTPEQAEDFHGRSGLIDLLADYQKKFREVTEEAKIFRAPAICDEACKRMGGIARYLHPVPINGSTLWLLPAGSRGRKEPAAEQRPQEPNPDSSLSIESLLADVAVPPPAKTGAPVSRTFSEYAAAVQKFDWDVFLQLSQGERFFEWLRVQLIPAFDLVLIDSRTGVTEMGGVCTRLLADLVVCCIAPNQQNIDGSVRMTRTFRRPDVLQRRGGKPEVILVPCRVDDRSETDSLTKEFKPQFDQIERSQDPVDGHYWFSTHVFRFEEEPLNLTAAPSSSSTSVGPKYTFWKHYIPYFPKLSYQEALTFPHPGGPVRVIELPDMQAKCRRLGAHLALHATDGSPLRTKLASAIESEAPEFVDRLALAYASSDYAQTGADLRARLASAGLRLMPDLDHRDGWQTQNEATLGILRESRAVVVLLSPGALGSPWLRQELRYARQIGKCVFMVVADSGILRDPTTLSWLGTFYDLGSDWDKLLSDLRSPCPAQRAPNMSPNPQESYVERPAEQSLLRDRLLEGANAPSPTQISVWGQAGSGKTQLAARVCQDDDIQDAFPGGILWMSLDNTPDFTAHLSGIQAALTGQAAGIPNEDALRSNISGRLAGRRFLLVVDGLSDKQLLNRLPQPKGPNVTLILTRDFSVVPPNTTCVTLGFMSAGEALQVLGGGLESNDKLAGLAESLYRWPLLLGLTRKSLVADLARGSIDQDQAVESASAVLARQGPTAFDLVASSERDSVSARIKRTLDALALTERDRQQLTGFVRGQASPDWLGGPTFKRLRNFLLVDGGSDSARPVPFFKDYLEKQGWVETAAPASTSRRNFSSAENHKVNEDVKHVRQALQTRRVTDSAGDVERQRDEVKRRIKRLKGANYFDYARNYAALVRRDQQLCADTGFRDFLRQQHALCTYKDPDLPSDQRLDRALAILGPEDIAKTTDPETLGIAGAIHKAKWKVDGQKHHLEQALEYYRRGYQSGFEEDYGYTGINAAFILDALACREQQTRQTEVARERRREADEIRERLARDLPALPDKADKKGKPQDWLRNTWWFLATLAEACFGLGIDADGNEAGQRLEQARYWLREALATDVSHWEYRSTANQFIDLAEARGMRLDEAGSDAMRTLQVLLEGDLTTVANLRRGKVGLALSGGGFRASLFHIGVLARLAELDLLKHVEVISCVSGGSILGAHYYLEARNQLQHTGTLERDQAIAIVKRLEERFLAGVQQDLRNSLFAEWKSAYRMLFNPGFSQTERLGERYEDVLYSQVDDGEGHQPRLLPRLLIKPPGVPDDFSPKIDNWRRESKVPILLLNATTLNTGHTWQFAASFMGEPAASINSEIDAGERLRRMYYDQEGVPERYRSFRLGHAVASSAAVPLLFDPLELPGLFPGQVVRLSDGGVHDNQGTATLLEQECTVLLVSDASGQMATEHEPGQGHVSVFYRANDILQERIRWAGFEEVEALRSAGVLRELMFVHLKKDLETEPKNWVNNNDRADPPDDPADPLPEAEVHKPTSYGVLKHVQRMLSALRTDLDSFTDQEAYALMLSGYRMVDTEFAGSLQDLSPARLLPGENWKFLDAVDILEDASADWPMLRAGHKVLFKPWALSSKVRNTVEFLIVLAGAELLWLLLGTVGLTWPTVIDAVWSLLAFLALGTVACAISGLALWLLMKMRGVRRAPDQIIFNVFFCLGGAIFLKFYLAFLAPWYLEKGRLAKDVKDKPNPAPEKRLRYLSRIAVAVFVGLALVLAVRVGNPITAPSRVQALLRHASWFVPAEPEKIAGSPFSLFYRFRALLHHAPWSLRGDLDKALSDYDLAIDVSSSMPDEQRGPLFAQRAYLKRLQRDNAGAAQDLQQAVHLQPENAQNWRDLGYVNLLLKHYVEAFQAYQTALTWAPNGSALFTQIRQEYDYSKTLLPTVSSALPILYIHVADKSLVPRMDGLAQALKSQDIVVPPVQVVGAVPFETQLFHSAGDSKAADSLVKSLSDIGLKATSKPQTENVPNRFELWLGKDNPLLLPK